MTDAHAICPPLHRLVERARPGPAAARSSPRTGPADIKLCRSLDERRRPMTAFGRADRRRPAALFRISDSPLDRRAQWLRRSRPFLPAVSPGGSAPTAPDSPIKGTDFAVLNDGPHPQHPPGSSIRCLPARERTRRGCPRRSGAGPCPRHLLTRARSAGQKHGAE